MVPFFGSHVRQNTDPTATRSILDTHVGQPSNHITKQEQGSFFKPTKNISYINGTPNNINNEIERYI